MKKMLLFIALALVAGCSYRFMPVNNPGSVDSNEFAVIETDSITVIAANSFWNQAPSNVTDQFLPFQIIIQNNTAAPLKVTPQDITLQDHLKNQYDVVPIEMIIGFYKPSELVITSAMPNPQEQENAWNQWQEIQQNLTSDSFHFGTIQPGARKQGFVFFHRLPSSEKTCTLNVLSQELLFQRK